jgi:hypothetical protein
MVMKISLVPIALTLMACVSAAPLPNATAQPAEQMETSMREMQRLMERARNTADPGERRRLMDEHMHAMHGGMAMMGPMMRGQGAPARSGDECRQNDNECRMRHVQDEQRRLGERMDMMQMMMQQMMDQMMMRDSEGADRTAPRGRRQDRADPQPREERK